MKQLKICTADMLVPFVTSQHLPIHGDYFTMVKHFDVNSALVALSLPVLKHTPRNRRLIIFSRCGKVATFAYCGTFEKQHILLNSRAVGFISFISTGHAGWRREGEQANFKDPWAASPHSFDSSAQYRALFNIFSFQHKTRPEQKKEKKDSAFYLIFFFFFFLLHFQPLEAIFIQQYWCWLYCSVGNGPWDQSQRGHFFPLIQ